MPCIDLDLVLLKPNKQVGLLIPFSILRMNILVTGAAGFIGFHTVARLLEKGHTIWGLDSINDYYDPRLKYDRLAELGIEKPESLQFGEELESKLYPGRFYFVRSLLEDHSFLDSYFDSHTFDVVCHLAAQAGVRYSLENPRAYIDSNITGFFNILNNCHLHTIKHLVYASSSSVYGNSKTIPFKTTDPVDRPISLYAATKKSNELMAHTYSHLFDLPTTGLRFFTVYGPWGRPDMAMHLFTDAILSGKPIKVFNYGEMERDFTYIDDIVQGLIRVMESDVEVRKRKNQAYKLYNIGNNRSVRLMDFIGALEGELGIVAAKELMPIQPGDVDRTWANVDDLIADYQYAPGTSIEDGVRAFVKWYKDYYESRKKQSEA